MFANWGFLLGEIWGLILFAALAGLLAGWLIWNRSKELLGVRASLDQKNRELSDLNSRVSGFDRETAGYKSRIAQVEAEHHSAIEMRQTALADLGSRDQELTALRAATTAAQSKLSHSNGSDKRVDELTNQLAQCRKTVESRDAEIKNLQFGLSEAARDYDGDGVIEGKDESTKPLTLTSARNGKADDLKLIKGVGPKLEGLLHRMGFFHFDQLAAWSDQEVAWVDANLEGFSGRVSRDRWIDQAKILAAGGTTEFAERVEDGNVYGG